MPKKNYKPTKNDLRKQGREQNIERAKKTYYDKLVERDDYETELAIQTIKKTQPKKK